MASDEAEYDFSNLSLPALIERSAELRSEVERMEGQVAVSSSTDLVHVSSTAEDLKLSMAIARSALTRKSAELHALSDEIRRQMEIERSKINSVIDPLRRQVKMLEEGLWTVSLYLGADEQIVQIADGDPADINEPISIRQEVLAMDEQMMEVWHDGKGLDARHVEMFDEWLLDPENLAAVLPERKGVVVFRPRRQFRDYGNEIANDVMAQLNAQSYWLIRNGDRLWRMTTDIQVGDHLVPRDDEYEAPFWRDQYESGSDMKSQRVRKRVTWSHDIAKAEERVEALRRHFTRTTLVLQGLLDRTMIFHPLQVARAALTDLDTYEGIVRIVRDNERLLGDGHVPFVEWQQGLMSKLAIGMRVVGNWRSADERVSPSSASDPLPSEVYLVEEKRGGAFVFKYERRDSRYGWEFVDYGRWGEWPYKNRASCKIFPSDPFVIPIDAATVEEMERYLNWRTERHNYLSMVPLLKIAIAAKKEEIEQERPFRMLLVGEIIKAGGSPTDAEIDDLVRWWKLLNKFHRALVDPDPKLQAKALREIVAEWSHRSTTEPSVESIDVEQLKRLSPDAIAILRKRDGTYVIVEKQPSKFDRGVLFNPFFKVTYRTLGGRSEGTVEVKEWQILGARRNRWRLLWSTEAWDSWPLHTVQRSEHLTDDEISLVAQLVQKKKPDSDLIGMKFESGGYSEGAYLFDAWKVELPFADLDLDEISPNSAVTLSVVKFEYIAERKNGKIVGIESSGWSGGSRSEGPFNRDGSLGDITAGFHAVFSLNEGAFTSAVEKVKPYIEAKEGALGRFHFGRSVYAATVDMVAGRLEEEERQRFLRDYLDPELWPARLAKIKQDLRPWSHELYDMVADLAVQRVEVVGKTLPELVDIYWSKKGRRPHVDPRMIDVALVAPKEDE